MGMHACTQKEVLLFGDDAYLDMKLLVIWFAITRLRMSRHKRKLIRFGSKCMKLVVGPTTNFCGEDVGIRKLEN